MSRSHEEGLLCRVPNGDSLPVARGIFFFQAEDGIRDLTVTGVQTCALPISIAGGEVLTRRQSFVPWLQGRALDIVQPDVTKVGGISEERKIAWMAEENGDRKSVV